MRVYLAGAINGQSDAQCKPWREAAAQILADLGHEGVDPMRRDYRGKELDNVTPLVLADLEDIRSCDAVLVRCGVPSWGTAMEIHFAHSRRKVIAGFALPPTPSPWLLFHLDEKAVTLDEAIAKLVARWPRERP